jgi:signal transduction histidine kinase
VSPAALETSGDRFDGVGASDRDLPPDVENEGAAVLCVDDHPENLSALTAILKPLRIRVVTALGGSRALLALLRDTFAVVLLDVAMPEMNGIEAASIIKSRERTRHTPIIFLTAGEADLEQAKQGYAAGAADYLFKPLDAEVVRAKVSVFVELHRRGEKIARQAALLRDAERRQRELELDELRHRVERRYQHLGDAVSQLVLRARVDGTVDFANKRWVDFTGASLGASTGDGWQRALHPNDAERFVTQWHAAAAGGDAFRAECRLRAASGAYRWFLCEGAPERGPAHAALSGADEGEASAPTSATRDSTLIGLVASFTDVTEQKRIDEERAELLQREHAARLDLESALRRSDLMASAGQVLSRSLDPADVLGGLAGALVEWLATWCVVDRVVAPADGRGAPVLSQIAFAHASEELRPLGAELGRDATPAAESGVASVLAGGEATLCASTDAASLARALGTEQVGVVERLGAVSCMWAPLRVRGEVIGALTLVSRDRAFGPVDLALAIDLAHRAALALDNGRLFAEAQDAIRLREDFVSIASHELRTPLSALQLQVESARVMLRGATPDPVRLLGKLDVAERQVGRLTRLVGELLDVSRIRAGRLELDREDVDLVEVVREVISRFSYEISRSQTAVNVDMPESLVVHVDRLRLDQVITNLLHNALKYGRGRPVEVSLCADGDVTRLHVRDQGIGIAEDDVGRVFGRFERAVSSRSYGGIGVGLYIVDQIVRAHGAAIRVESALGEGSTFVVELPTAATTPDRAAAPAHEP